LLGICSHDPHRPNRLPPRLHRHCGVGALSAVYLSHRESLMETKPWYRSKLIWFNIAVATGPLVAYIVANPAFIQAHLTPPAFIAYSFAIGILNVILRVITATGISIFGGDS